MAPSKSKRRSRKRRKPGSAPRAVQSQRRESRAERQLPADRQTGHSKSELALMAEVLTGRTYGEPPANPFGGVPVSEIAIFTGGVAVLVWFASRATISLLVVGIVVCVLGVLEVTVREHFSGYRSHTLLLAAVPPVAILAVAVAVLGSPRHRTTRELLLLAAVPIFGALFYFLRKRFRTARQARVVRPPVA